MNKILKLYTNDLKQISTNWVAAILIGGLIFLPSLYAWLNILASWDPYGQTDQIPVAIVNEDEGAIVRDEQFEVGDQIVSNLKNNHDMDWNFTSREKAMQKVEYGDYFAVIIIPKDFSQKLSSVISANPEKAEMEYYVNEKINSIAPKITEKGATVIVEQISGQFVSTVNGIIFDLFNQIGIEIETELPDIKQFEAYVMDIEAELPEINTLLNGTLDDASSAQNIIGKAKKAIPDATRLTNEGLQTINETTNFLVQAENRLNELSPKINQDLEKVQGISSEVNEFLKTIQETELDFTELERAKKELNDKLTNSIDIVGKIESQLIQLKEMNSTKPPKNEDDTNTAAINGQDVLDNAIERTSNLRKFLEEANANALKVNELVNDKQEQFNASVNDLQGIAENTSVKIDGFMTEYKNTIEPTVLKEISNAKSTLGEAKGMLVGIQSTIPEIDRILTSTNGHVDEGKEIITNALNEFPFVNDKVKQLANKIRNVQEETDINELIELLKNDPDAERSFFEEPIILHENALFPIENYGTGMTPFYTVLSIWVGCLLLISLLAINNDTQTSITSKQMYFSRLLTFWTIGILQTIIVTVGDVTFIGVNAHNPVWFVVFGLFISLVFMSIVYTFVSVFGDVGKALAIVMLVLQIAGSGGTYPVALLPKFFQFINPILPFTYANDLMREAVGGIVWEKALSDILFLFLFSMAFLLFGTFLKARLNKTTDKLLQKSRESGLFH